MSWKSISCHNCFSCFKPNSIICKLEIKNGICLIIFFSSTVLLQHLWMQYNMFFGTFNLFDVHLLFWWGFSFPLKTFAFQNLLISLKLHQICEFFVPNNWLSRCLWIGKWPIFLCESNLIKTRSCLLFF